MRMHVATGVYMVSFILDRLGPVATSREGAEFEYRIILCYPH
jgi:hypothetical protein